MQLNASHKGNKRHLLFSALMSAVFVLSFVLELKILLVLLFVLGTGFLALAYQDFEIRPIQLIVALFFITVFAPLIEISDSIPAIRPEQFLFFSVFPILFVLQKRDPYPQLNLFIKFFIAFQLLQIFSLFYGKVFMGSSVGFKDLVEIFRVLEYGLVAFIIGHFAITKNELRSLLFLMILFFAGSAIIGLFQYYGILGLDRITAPLYFEGRLHDVHERVMGTFVNPNTYGTFASLGAIITLGTLFYEKSKGIKLLLFAVFLILIWTVALTQSRTAFVVFLTAVLSLVLIYGYSMQLKWYTIVAIFGGVIVILGGIGFLLSDQIISRFETLLNFMEDLSWQMRLFAWYINLHLFIESPLFGWGPGFHQFSPTVDSDYILILRRYGLVGFFVYLGFYFIPLKHAFNYIKGTNIRAHFNRIFIACTIVFLVGNIPNSLFHEMQFIGFWAIFLGVLYAVNKKKGDS